MLKIKHKLVGLLIFLSIIGLAQKINLSQKNWDTTKYEKFNNRIIVAYFQSYKRFNSEIKQVTLRDTLAQSTYNYLAEANYISGIELNFDKINIQLALKSSPPKDVTKFGKTNFFNLGFNFGGNHWFLESSYRRYTGFYDNNTPNYDTSFKRTGNFRKLPNMSSTLTKLKFLYFTNYKKYSFRSGYACNYRQLKSAASWVLSSNFYTNNQISDSAFVPSIGRPYYRHFSDLNSIQVTGFSVNAGFTFNLVLWKAWFMNLLFTIGPEQQWRKYGLVGQGSGKTLSYLSISGDFRVSMGLNMKKFYVLFSSSLDYTSYNNYIVQYYSRFTSNNFTIGWRFKVKTPEIYKKFQQTSFYKIL